MSNESNTSTRRGLLEIGSAVALAASAGLTLPALGERREVYDENFIGMRLRPSGLHD